MPAAFSSSFWIANTLSVRENVKVTPWPTAGAGANMLRALVIAAGLSWSLVFIVVALEYELQLYADGAMFSYAVAAQDVWAFHWHNISGRLTVFFLSLWPAELYVGLTGSPWGGIVVYGLLFYVSPLIGLVATFVADRSRGRTIFAYACFSTALLCPLVFGFPTEIWMAHALFWPTLAVAHYAQRGVVGAVVIFAMLVALMFTHEGALVLALTIVATLALRGLRNAPFMRGASAFIAALTVWTAVKLLLPPDKYFAGVLIRAALHFFDLAIFEVNLFLLLLAALASYGFVFVGLSRFAPHKAYLCAAAVVIALLAVYWISFDHSIHANNRYYMRTALVTVTPALGALAVSYALRADGVTLCIPRLERTLTALTSGIAIQMFAGAFILVTLVYAVETAKFISGWTSYKAAVKALAIGTASDPSLGDSHFVSSDRIGAHLNRLSWFSTTQYLSIIVADFAPSRFVIDPASNYFWLSCITATSNSNAARLIPIASRNFVQIYSCLHR